MLPDIRPGIIVQVLLISQHCFFIVVFYRSMPLGGVLEDPVGMDPRAGCLLSDEYLMGLNGDLCLRSVALSFPTHNRESWVEVVASSCRVTRQLPLISS